MGAACLGAAMGNFLGDRWANGTVATGVVVAARLLGAPVALAPRCEAVGAEAGVLERLSSLVWHASPAAAGAVVPTTTIPLAMATVVTAGPLLGGWGRGTEGKVKGRHFGRFGSV